MRVLMLALVLATQPIVAQSSNVITFDANYSYDSPHEYEEAGFQYQNSLAYRSDRHLYLHDDAGITSSTFRRSDGGLFDAVSVDLRGYSKLFISQLGPSPDGNEYNTFFHDSGDTIHLSSIPILAQLSGHRNGSRVSLFELSFGSGFQWSNLSFGADFKAIDALTFSLLIPEPSGSILVPNSIESRPLGSVFCGDSWCGGLQADNLRLTVLPPSPVPLPAGGLPLAGGFFFLSALAVRRRCRGLLWRKQAMPF